MSRVGKYPVPVPSGVTLALAGRTLTAKGKLGELKLEMLAEAAKDARNRAENILRSAGNTDIGPLVYSSMGIININPANSTETSNEGNNDTSSYEKDIITIVRAEYKVK